MPIQYRRIVQRHVLLGVLVALLIPGSAAHGEVTLRMAAIAPEGTAWAREFHALARNLDTLTAGEVKMKWYLGGIAGDEQAALARAQHGQLDGLAGASICQMLAPSMHVMRIPGIFDNRDQAMYVLGRLGPSFDEEMHSRGFTNLGSTVIGVDVLFSRTPIRTLSQLRGTRWWMWTFSPVARAIMPALGVPVVFAELDQMAPALEAGQIDGFIAPPTVALAYQWSPLARYFTPLEIATLPGCVVIADHALDALTNEQKQQVQTAVARFRIRWHEVNVGIDEALVNGLLAKQGLRRVEVSQTFRAEFAAAARHARAALPESVVPRRLVQKVEELLAEYRAELMK